MVLVYPRFEELYGEPLYADELGEQLALAAIVHEEASADNEGRELATARELAERVAQALYHVYGGAQRTAEAL
jgi:hypothetical protein